MLKRLGFFLGPLLFGWALWQGPQGLSGEGKVVLGLGGWMAARWITEAAPIPATSLLPIIILPAFKVLKIKELTSSYADPIIFLFLGGFILARALEVNGLHRPPFRESDCRLGPPSGASCSSPGHFRLGCPTPRRQ